MKYLLSLFLVTVLGFRFWGLALVPNGYAWDEMDNAYQAYSLLKTGRDIFGNPLPVLIHAFADYKSSLYVYLSTPGVMMWGPNVLAARVPSAVMGAVAVLAFGYLMGKRWGSVWGLLSAIVMALSPWWWHYSHLSFEAVVMMTFFLLGLACFEKWQHASAKWLYLTALMFTLSIWSYSIAKLFVPLFVLLLFTVYFQKFRNASLRSLTTAALIIGLVSLPPLWQSFFGKGGTRFSEISILTDPTIHTEVNFALEEGQISSGVERQVGLSPRIIDRIAHNKLTYTFTRFITNYESAFSTQFLFTLGDPNLRHSPGRNSIGQFYLSDLILLICGLIFLSSSSQVDRKYKLLLLGWLAISPLPAALTRDGANHATRLIFMLPAVLIIFVAGVKWLSQKSRPVLLATGLVCSYFVFSFIYYYFSHYRFESAQPFQWGFEQVALLAQDNSTKYDQVFIDTGETSNLMAWLTATKYDPGLLQNSHPLPMVEIAPGIMANKFGNVVILPPGHRSWGDMITSKAIPSNSLLILSAEYLPPLPIYQTINSPSGQPAFYTLET